MRNCLPIVLVLLAGCASPPPSDHEEASVTSSTTQQAPPAVEPQYTDVVHLLDPPNVSPDPLDSYESIRIPLYSAILQPNEAHPEWTVAGRAGMAVLEGDVTLWAEIAGSVVGNPQGGCFWLVQFVILAEDSEFRSQACGDEGATPQPGLRTVEIPYRVELDAPLPENATIGVVVSHSAHAMLPGSSVHLLTASIEHDSTLELRGLNTPVNATFGR